MASASTVQCELITRYYLGPRFQNVGECTTLWQSGYCHIISYYFVKSKYIYVVTCMGVTVDGVWIGNSIY
jgi:hypothetical protein